MTSVLIVAEPNDQIEKLAATLDASGFTCSRVSTDLPPDEPVTDKTPDLILITDDGMSSAALINELRRLQWVPRIVLTRPDTINHLNGRPDVDDFLIEPWDPAELVIRSRRLLGRTGGDPADQISRGALVINTARCEVTIAGHPILLTFKEYELLRFLASSPGRVFTRDSLLNRVWGYDYFGGDRTVDVHVRRLRSKIEPLGHNFIETVRNIGYRFARSD